MTDYLVNLLNSGDIGIDTSFAPRAIRVRARSGREAVLWRQEDGTWWIDSDEPHTPEPLHEALPWALRVCGINKDDLP